MGDDGRRNFISLAGAGALLALGGAAGAEEKGPDKDDVGAVEDLMREHGVIRRALVIYRESALKLRAAPEKVSAPALQETAKLMRQFGEEYHERLLEEAWIFPAVKKAGGEAAALVDTLRAQHQRGRELTQLFLEKTAKGIGAGDAAALAAGLEAFARMYELHAAYEDTLVFPAWKKALSAKQLDELGDRFEELEQKTLGKDGFEHAVAQIGKLERLAGVELASLTAPLSK